MPASTYPKRTSSVLQRAPMRAATMIAPRTVIMSGNRLPSPGPGQVRVRLEGCGVCASNLPVWEGRPWFCYPLEAGGPGHEGWGRVHALGEGVTTLREGDRVALLSYHAFAQYDVADANAAVRLPCCLDNTPVPGEPLGCAMNIFNRADVRADQRVAIIGVGFLGALLVQLASRAGAEVLAISRRPASLQAARRSGAHHTVSFAEPQEVLAEAQKYVNGCGYERVIEATGKQSGLDAATQLVAERGKLIIAGYHQDGPRQVDMQLWNWRGIDVVNAHERKQQTYVAGMNAAVQAAADGRLDFASLLTHRFDLADLSKALSTACERPDGFMKAYVTCAS